MDEYDIRINGSQVFKKYKTHLKTGNGRDDVFGVEFHDFRDTDNTLIAWMWFGKTSFKAAIKEDEISRGLRLRKENIQIGEDDTLRDMFTRESSKRGNNYFIGEIFAVSRELIPNSQRAYFNENPVRIDFEHKIKDYFNNTLYYIYYEGSDINSSIKKINSYAERAAEFEKKIAKGGFLSTEEREREQGELEIKKHEAEKAKKNLEKKKESGRSYLTPQIVERRIDDISNIQLESITPIISTTKANGENNGESEEIASYRGKKKFLVDTMFPAHNKNERKLLSETLDKIFVIIQNSVDKKTAEIIINRIKEDLK
jgi:molecular chaperone HtpG